MLEQTKLSHSELCVRAESWLRTHCNCSSVISELKSRNKTGEIPDAIGWKRNRSFLVECKTSRADFKADAKKPFRSEPKIGMGDFRFYLCPEGVIKVEELPEKWGLIYVNDTKIRMVKGPKGSYWSKALDFRFNGNKDAEMTLLLSFVRRTQVA